MNQIKELAELLVSSIIEKYNSESRLLIAIDGRCASGKTTLSAELQKILLCNVIHMDQFFLRPEQRSEYRLALPGENVDHERFLSEVLIPLTKGEEFAYSPFDCKTMMLREKINIGIKRINIIEGSYSCHNSLFNYYDLRIFLDVSKTEQIRRILLRDGSEQLKMFETKWIPLEEMYFKEFDIANRCDYIFTT